MIVQIFLGHSEDYKAEVSPKLYVIYVDDIYAMFHENVPFHNFLNIINSQQPTPFHGERQ